MFTSQLDNLSHDANIFQKRAIQMRRKFWWQNVKVRTVNYLELHTLHTYTYSSFYMYLHCTHIYLCLLYYSIVVAYSYLHFGSDCTGNPW